MSFLLLVPTAGRVTSPFGERIHPISKAKSFHKGVDIAQPGRHDVVTAADGTVIRVVTDSKFWGYGKTVIVRHKLNGISFETLYAHLDTVDVVNGQSVKAGRKLGLQGNTGNSTGQHLHFEVHIPAYAPYQPNVVDPMNYISWPAIRSAQELLNKVGYKLSVDGIEGPKTIAAVKDFQRKNGLTVDGIAGAKTLAALAKANEPKKEVTPVANNKPKVNQNEPSAWAKKEWEVGKKHGILQVEGERPKDMATREEVNAMIVRALKLK